MAVSLHIPPKSERLLKTRARLVHVTALTVDKTNVVKTSECGEVASAKGVPARLESLHEERRRFSGEASASEELGDVSQQQ